MAELDGKAIAKALGELIAERDALKVEAGKLRKGFKALYDSYYPDQQYEAFEDMYTRLECAFYETKARAERAEAMLARQAKQAGKANRPGRAG